MSSNFDPINTDLPQLAELGRQAEARFAADPLSAAARLRQFGEGLASELVRLHNLPTYTESQYERLDRLDHQSGLDRDAISRFHTIRKEGNKSVHHHGDVTHSDAMKMLRAAHALTGWYWTEFTTHPTPKPGPFVKPVARDSRGASQVLRAQLEAERAEKHRVKGALDDMMRLLRMPEVATHNGFEPLFRQLTDAQRTSITGFLTQFREEPIHEDWPLEVPDGMTDDKVRTVRVDGLIVTVLAPARADILFVVHVGTPDQAKDWASGRRFEVHPTIGTVQIYDVQQAEAVAEGLHGGLFDTVSDEDLVGIGLPSPLIAAVRALSTEAELDALSPHLPPESTDGLYLLACGYEPAKVSRELDRDRDAAVQVDTEDFAAAVHHPDSRRSFIMLDAPEALRDVLEGSVEAWRLYLHPDQRKLVRMKAKGPIRVLGGAGTGKTVALLHRARFLSTEVFTEPDDRLLVTTYTRNLAADLRHQLGKLVPDDVMHRVEVLNLHALAARLWKKHGDARSAAFGPQCDDAWATAILDDELGLPEAFYRAEWEQVVQANDVEELATYLRVRRTGRGVRLSRKQRRAAWEVLRSYREQLDSTRRIEVADQLRILRRGLEDGSIPRPFATALADEVQDFGVPELMFLRSLVAEAPHDLFLVGDAHQRIYGRPVRMSHCGIEIRGRARRLRVNYRTTARVKSWAVAALTGAEYDDMDGGLDTLDGYHSLRLGVDPKYTLFSSRDEELNAAVSTVRDWLTEVPAKEICVAAHTNKLVYVLSKKLTEAGIQPLILERDASDEGEGVRLATFHRLKGLEFPRVLLTCVEKGTMPFVSRAVRRLDAEERQQQEKQQRCLLYVAATRARDVLEVTGRGERSPFVG